MKRTYIGDGYRQVSLIRRLAIYVLEKLWVFANKETHHGR